MSSLLTVIVRSMACRICHYYSECAKITLYKRFQLLGVSKLKTEYNDYYTVDKDSKASNRLSHRLLKWIMDREDPLFYISLTGIALLWANYALYLFIPHDNSPEYFIITAGYITLACIVFIYSIMFLIAFIANRHED